MLIRLDERLTAVAALVDYGSVADVGCDHGKLGFYLLGTERANGVIATDISEGSLSKARQLAFENDLQMQTRLGDGLEPIGDGEVDTVVIAGLGGDVISEILARARGENKRFKHFVLSPNTHAEKVRRELVAQEHRIAYDNMVECAGKRYTVIKTDIGKSELDEYQLEFGAFYKDNERILSYIAEELEYKQGILALHSSPALESRVELLKKALDNARSENED